MYGEECATSIHKEGKTLAAKTKTIKAGVLLKSSAVGLVLLFCSGFSESAHAGGYKHYKHYGHGYHHGHYRHRRHKHSNKGAYLAGGLIIGSLLTHAYHRNNDRYYNDRYYNDRYEVRERRAYREPVVVRREVVRAEPVRTLFRDRNGNCYERHYNRGGDEVLSELPPEACYW